MQKAKKTLCAVPKKKIASNKEGKNINNKNDDNKLLAEEV